MYMLFILSSLVYTAGADVSTVCYGATEIPCTNHSLYCTEPLVITITHTLYGYRAGCIHGVSNCMNTTCCHEQPGDFFIPFHNNEEESVKRECSGKPRCSGKSTRNVYDNERTCGVGTLNTYTKIEYECIDKFDIKTIGLTSRQESSTTINPTPGSTGGLRGPGVVVQGSTEGPIGPGVVVPGSTEGPRGPGVVVQGSTGGPTVQGSTEGPTVMVQVNEDSETGIIVGSVVVVVGVIGGIIVVLLMLKRKHKSRVQSPTEEQHYAGIDDLRRDQTPNTYDSLQMHGADSHCSLGRDQTPNTYDSLQMDSADSYNNLRRDQSPNAYDSLQMDGAGSYYNFGSSKKPDSITDPNYYTMPTDNNDRRLATHTANRPPSGVYLALY